MTKIMEGETKASRDAVEEEEEEEEAKSRSSSSIWDCDSCLYDSYELKSLNQQLESAMIASRTHSMPRSKPAPSTKINSRPLLKLIRSFFRGRSTTPTSSPAMASSNGGCYRSSGDWEKDVMFAGGRRTSSERFTCRVVGIYCV